MIDLTNIHSLSEFQRNTKRYVSQMQESEKPIVLTVNGQAQLVVQDAKAYQKLLDRLEFFETVAALKEGIAEIDAGQAVPAQQALQAVKKLLQPYLQSTKASVDQFLAQRREEGKQEE